MAAYRIGPSDFFTPSDLLADANTLNNQVNRLNDQDWTKPSQALFDAFQNYLSEWRRFYSGMGFFSALNNSNRDQLIQMEQRFEAFAENYQSEAGVTVPDIVNVSTGSKDGLGDHIKNQLQPLLPSVNIVYVIAAILVAGVVLYLGRAWFVRKVTT